MELYENFKCGTGFVTEEVHQYSSIMRNMNSLRHFLTAMVVLLCGQTAHSISAHSTTSLQGMVPSSSEPEAAPAGKSFAVFAGGCFWCTEAIYVEMRGVDHVESGYTGGHVKNPAYREVCSGRTGHAEGVRITFDPEVVSYQELLDVFWRTHDPTTLNRQGADVGTQYRSAIFPQNEEQEKMARASLAAADEAGLWSDPIVTTIEPAAHFYVAEDHHQDYYARNSDQGYCVAVVGPKVKKFRALFADKLKNVAH